VTDPTPEPVADGDLYRMSITATGVVTDNDGNVVHNEGAES
jgi:hypothetical protein